MSPSPESVFRKLRAKCKFHYQRVMRTLQPPTVIPKRQSKPISWVHGASRRALGPQPGRAGEGPQLARVHRSRSPSAQGLQDSTADVFTNRAYIGLHEGDRRRRAGRTRLREGYGDGSDEVPSSSIEDGAARHPGPSSKGGDGASESFNVMSSEATCELKTAGPPMKAR